MRRRLDPERHGTDGFTTVGRVASIAAAVVFLGVGLHLALGAWYADRIMPGVVAAGQKLGDLTVPEARQVLQRQAATYRLDLTVAGQRYELTAAQLGVQFDPEGTLKEAYKVGRGAFIPWPGDVARKHVVMRYRVDRSQLGAFTTSVAAQVGVQPVDAAVVVKNGKLETVPDKPGMTVDRIGLQRLIELELQLVPFEML